MDNIDVNVGVKIPIRDIQDGRKDIYLSVPSKEGSEESTILAVITQETLEGYKIDYETARNDPMEIASVLFALGTFVASQAHPDKPMIDIAKMIQAYPEAVGLINYFIRRCEGKEVPEGHGMIQSRKAYAKFKEFQMKWMPSTAEEKSND
jgi:hypothetical protein